MTIPNLEGALANAYNRLEAAIVAHANAAEAHANAKAVYEYREAEARVYGLLDGDRMVGWAELGRNDTERAARFLLLFPTNHPDEVAALDRAEADISEAKLELDLARLEWEYLRYRLRLLEVEAGLDRGRG